MKTALQVLVDALRCDGFTGLYWPGECGCTLDDISPGDCFHNGCMPGYVHERIDSFVVTGSERRPSDADMDAMLEADVGGGECS